MYPPQTPSSYYICPTFVCMHPLQQHNTIRLTPPILVSAQLNLNDQSVRCDIDIKLYEIVEVLIWKIRNLVEKENTKKVLTCILTLLLFLWRHG